MTRKAERFIRPAPGSAIGGQADENPINRTPGHQKVAMRVIANGADRWSIRTAMIHKPL